jgi:DNA-directed RNA polymerase specialized sigma24 family protein
MPASIPPPYVLAHCPRTPEEDARIGALMDRTIAGDTRAWKELCLAVAPIAWAATAGHQATGRLRASTDDRLQVGVCVLGILADHDFHALRTLRRPGGNPEIRAWIATVSTRAAVDHVRKHAERLGRITPENDTLPPPPEELPADLPDPSWLVDARSIAAELLPELTPQQREALSAWLLGCRHAETANDMGLPDAVAAERLVTSAVKRLARRVAEPTGAARR